jgi:hypothetical protein
MLQFQMRHELGISAMPVAGARQPLFSPADADRHEDRLAGARGHEARLAV